MASILTDPPTTKSLGSNNAPQRLPITVATFEPRQYAACSKAVLVPTWYGFNYNTCKLQYTLIACTEIVTPTTCPPSRRASPPTIPPPTQPRPESQDHVGDSASGLTNGEVAGITIASAVLLILLLALAVWFYRIIQREKKPQQPLAREYDGSGRERRMATSLFILRELINPVSMSRIDLRQQLLLLRMLPIQHSRQQHQQYLGPSHKIVAESRSRLHPERRIAHPYVLCQGRGPETQHLATRSNLSTFS